MIGSISKWIEDVGVTSFEIVSGAHTPKFDEACKAKYRLSSGARLEADTLENEHLEDDLDYDLDD